MHGVQFYIAEKNHMNFYLFCSIHGPPDPAFGKIYVLAETIHKQEVLCIVELYLTINVQNMAEADRKCQMS